MVIKFAAADDENGAVGHGQQGKKDRAVEVRSG